MIDVDLVALDATALSELVRARQVPARRLIEMTLRRIGDLDPTVNAYRTVLREQALAEADGVDALSDDELAVLPLAGVPVAIKDDTDVAGQVTAWGSGVDRGRCRSDAVVVRRLRQAGAVIIGKTNVPELTLWPWTASPRWGVTRNPWDLDRTPGGSSGGSAVAVATGMCALALGSDGGGSIRYPAGLTGLVGLKPQRDRVPIGPEHGSAWNGLVVLGPLARSVRDAALFLDVASADSPSSEFRSAARDGPAAARVAVSLNAPPGTNVTISQASRWAVDTAVEILRSRGHEIVDLDIEYGLASLWSSTVRLLKGVQDDVAAVPNRDALERRTRRVARLARLLPARSLRRAFAREPVVAASINAVFEVADVVITPLCAVPAPRLEDCPTTGAVRSLRACTTSAWLVPWNLIGQPAIAVPVGPHAGLPAGVHIAGRPHDEGTLLALAAEIEMSCTPQRWSWRS